MPLSLLVATTPFLTPHGGQAWAAPIMGRVNTEGPENRQNPQRGYHTDWERGGLSSQELGAWDLSRNRRADVSLGVGQIWALIEAPTGSPQKQRKATTTLPDPAELTEADHLSSGLGQWFMA